LGAEVNPGGKEQDSESDQNGGSKPSHHASTPSINGSVFQMSGPMLAASSERSKRDYGLGS
jgi:hypothetical protein